MTIDLSDRGISEPGETLNNRRQFKAREKAQQSTSPEAT